MPMAGERSCYHENTKGRNQEKNNFDAYFFQCIAEARSFVLKNIASYDTFGFDGSVTTRQLNIIEALRDLKKIVYDH